MTERGLAQLTEMFAFLNDHAPHCEIVVNDWGVLALLSERWGNAFTLCLGRLLVRQHRDPMAGTVIKKQLPVFLRKKDGSFLVVVHKQPPAGYRRWVRSSYVNAPQTQRFLAAMGIHRIELNNLVQGMSIARLPFRKTLYTPFVQVSTTRFCPMDTRHQKLYRIDVCRRECRRQYDELNRKGAVQVLYKRGNTVFYKNEAQEIKAQRLGFDRLVFQEVSFLSARAFRGVRP